MKGGRAVESTEGAADAKWLLGVENRVFPWLRSRGQGHDLLGGRNAWCLKLIWSKAKGQKNHRDGIWSLYGQNKHLNCCAMCWLWSKTEHQENLEENMPFDCSFYMITCVIWLCQFSMAFIVKIHDMFPHCSERSIHCNVYNPLQHVLWMCLVNTQ